jgi:transcriptional antiterminator RfaH
LSTTSEICDLWFAASVLPRHEKFVQRLLTYKGYMTSLPLRKCTHVRRSGSGWESEKPLISGYVFAAGDGESRVVSTPGVRCIVAFDGRTGLIPWAEIEALERIAASPLPGAECGFFKLGHPVRLVAGPLKGLEGTVIREPEGARFIVRVEMLQRSLAVEIDGAWAEPISAPHKGCSFSAVR